MSDIVIFSLHCITVILLIILSWTDIRSRIISNKIVFLLLLVIVPLAWIQYKQIFFLPALLTLVIGFLLFTFGVMGAGDIKLMSVLMLTIPHSQIIYFFLFTAFSG
ncbi:TPA: prepilin peptidase, partial [Pasteurella multocida]|nr:prepilin peptidase [Pasteurella multocida]